MAAEYLPLSDTMAPWIRPIGLTLLHALWQGLLIGALAAVALRALRQFSAQSRYATACIALAACVAWPSLTLWRLVATAPAFATRMSANPHLDAPASVHLDTLASSGTLDAVQPWLVAL